MPSSQKVSWILTGGVLISILGATLFLLLIKSPAKPLDVQEARVHQVDNCRSEIREIQTAAEGAMLGDAFFGGSRDYNLVCARLAYERALTIDAEGDAQAWYQLGRIDFLEGKNDEAIEKFNNQIKYFGDFLPNVHYMLGLTYGFRAKENNDTEDWLRAEEAFSTYLTHDPGSPWARTDLAWIHFSQGKYENMKPVLEEGLEDTPHHPWLLNMYGLSLLNTGKKDLAREKFLEAQKWLSLYTPEDWGRAYPGNNPASYEKGLNEMKQAIQHNIDISSN